MLGDVIVESRGNRVVRRVLSSEPLKVEVTFEENGKIRGTDYSGFGTYWSEARADGSLYGEGQGGYLTHDGELVAWKGSGLGKLKPGGAVSYRGILYFRTASQKLAAMNTVGGVFEFEVSADGTTQAKVWEWK
jgi:hypothetical protein